MSIIQLRDVTVTRLNNTGSGFVVTEENESRGKTYKTNWKVWPAASLNVAVGDVISLSGFHSAKVNEWEKDGVKHHSVELSVNSPRLVTEKPDQSAQSAPADEPWAATAPSYTDETPF